MNLRISICTERLRACSAALPDGAAGWLSRGECGVESSNLAVGRPRIGIEEGLEGNTVDDGNEAFRFGERVGLVGQCCAHPIGDVGAKVAVRVTLQGGELGIPTGLSAKSNRHIPVQAPGIINGEGIVQRVAKGVDGAVDIAVFASLPATLERRLECEPQQFATVAEVVHESAGGPSCLRSNFSHGCARDARPRDDARCSGSEFFSSGNGINGARH